MRNFVLFASTDKECCFTNKPREIADKREIQNMDEKNSKNGLIDNELLDIYGVAVRLAQVVKAFSFRRNRTVGKDREGTSRGKRNNHY